MAMGGFNGDEDTALVVCENIADGGGGGVAAAAAAVADIFNTGGSMMLEMAGDALARNMARGGVTWLGGGLYGW